MPTTEKVIINMDVDLKKRLKIYSASASTTMTQVLLNSVTEVLEKFEGRQLKVYKQNLDKEVKRQIKEQTKLKK